MSEDNKDKGSNQDKINALEAELKELKALEKAKAEEELKALEKAKAEEERISQEKIKKLNAEIDSIKKNSPTEEKEEVENFIPSKEEKVVEQTFSNSGEIKKKGNIGLIISLLYILLYNFVFLIAVFIKEGNFRYLPDSFVLAFSYTLVPFLMMLIPTLILAKKPLWRTIVLLFFTFWVTMAFSFYLYTP